MLSFLLRRWGALALILLAVPLSGCNGAVDLTPRDAAPASDAGAPAETLLLELLGPSSLELVFDEAAELSVRVTDVSGAPLEGADVAFALEGNANDSTLGTLGDTADMDGVAHGRVLAGRTATSFRVRITSPGAAPLFVQTSVSGHGFGEVDAQLVYRGPRALANLEVQLFAGSSCSMALLGDSPADRSRSLSPSETRVLITGLPALVHYALVVEGVGGSGVTLARGCLEDVLVNEDATTDVSVSVEDLPLDLVGEYDTTFSLSTGALATTLASNLRADAETRVADSGGDVSILLDALDAHFLREGDLTSSALLAAERAATSIEADLDARLVADASGPAVALANLADAIEADLARVEVNGVLSLGPDGGLSFRATQVSAGEAGSPLALLELASLGVHVRTDLSATLLTGEDAAQVDSLSIQLPGGALTQARMQATALAAGVDSAALWLSARAGCDGFAAFIASDPALAPSCDATCAAAVCGEAMAGLWGSMTPTLGRLDVERSGIELSGRLDFVEETGDLLVDRVSAARLVARTTGDGVTSDRLEASVEGSRTPLLP